MSHASAISNPPPEAMPLIAAIRGFEILVHFSNPPNPPSGCGPVGRPLSAVYFRSLPAETDPLPIASLRYKKSQYVFPSFAPPFRNMRWPLHVGIFCNVRQRSSCVHVGRFGALYIASKRTAAPSTERRGWGDAPALAKRRGKAPRLPDHPRRCIGNRPTYFMQMALSLLPSRSRK